MMMAAAKKIDWLTSAAAMEIVPVLPRKPLRTRMRCKVLGPWPRCAAASARCRKIFSTMMTVASTTNPKSMAPTDSRFADSPRSTMSPMAKDECERYGHRHDDGAAQIAEKGPLQQENQHDARDHVVQHGVGGDVDQIAAIVDALDADAGRQNAAAR